MLDFSLTACRSSTSFCAALVVALTSGCGGEPRGYVSGQVTRQDGTPVVAAVVMARAESTGKSAASQTDDQGRYSLGVAAMGDGIFPGDYAMVVMEERMGLDGGGNRTIPVRYRDYAQSGLKFTVADGETKTFDVKLEAQ